MAVATAAVAAMGIQPTIKPEILTKYTGTTTCGHTEAQAKT